MSNELDYTCVIELSEESSPGKEDWSCIGESFTGFDAAEVMEEAIASLAERRQRIVYWSGFNDMGDGSIGASLGIGE